MKTGIKQSLCGCFTDLSRPISMAALASLIVVFGFPQAVLAVETGPVAPVAANAHTIANSVSAVAGQPAMPAMPGVSKNDPMNIPAPPPGMGEDDLDRDAKDLAPVKSVVKRLGSSLDKVTVDDLNAARQAIARIELLIELEKKMGDLEKIRDSREAKVNMPTPVAPGRGGPGMTMPSGMGMPVPVSAQPLMPVAIEAPETSVDIVRILGRNGVYSAVISADGGDKVLHVGDTVGPGEKVVDIDSKSVIVDRKGDRRVIRIKNVDRIFTSSP